MKKVLISLIIIIIALIVYYFYKNISYQPSQIDKKMSSSTENLIKEVKKAINTKRTNAPTEIRDSLGNVIKEQEIKSIVWEKNIFDPKRGVKKAVVKKTTNIDGYDLIGICGFGSDKYIILSPHNDQGKDRHIYKRNDSLPNGMILKEISSNKIVVDINGELTELLLQFADEKSYQRIESGKKPKEVQNSYQPSTSKNMKFNITPIKDNVDSPIQK